MDDVIDPLIGTTVLANHRIVKKLGQGGMGAVYLARNPNIGSEVAVKVLLAEHSHREELLARFLDEARVPPVSITGETVNFGIERAIRGA